MPYMILYNETLALLSAELPQPSGWVQIPTNVSIKTALGFVLCCLSGVSVVLNVMYTSTCTCTLCVQCICLYMYRRTCICWISLGNRHV